MGNPKLYITQFSEEEYYVVYYSYHPVNQNSDACPILISCCDCLRLVILFCRLQLTNNTVANLQCLLIILLISSELGFLLHLFFHTPVLSDLHLSITAHSCRFNELFMQTSSSIAAESSPTTTTSAWTPCNNFLQSLALKPFIHIIRCNKQFSLVYSLFFSDWNLLESVELNLLQVLRHNQYL